MKMIDDARLLELHKQNAPLAIMAREFQCSVQAVCKRRKQLLLAARIENMLGALPADKRRFVAGIAAGESQTKAAREAFNCAPASAPVLGCKAAKDPQIKQAISEILEAEGLSKNYLARRLRDHVDGPDPGVSLRAVDIGFKLTDSYPIQKTASLAMNITVSPVNLDKYK